MPSGPFLLEQLTRPADRTGGAGVLLAVGGVRYDRDGAPADKAGKPWPNLPATDKERAGVVAEARKLPKPPDVVERTGADANVAQLVKDLPTARWAHLATHGFFAAPESQEREHLFRPDDFLMGVGGERRGAAARNPLTLSGLVLAGANQPTDADGGVLTGEAVAGLDLDDMDLAVLSACQTGLGEAADGEGVFGLQRAFHIAGAKNVVASLWKVDDEAAAGAHEPLLLPFVGEGRAAAGGVAPRAAGAVPQPAGRAGAGAGPRRRRLGRGRCGGDEAAGRPEGAAEAAGGRQGLGRLRPLRRRTLKQTISPQTNAESAEKSNLYSSPYRRSLR